MVLRTEKVERIDAGWETFENLLPANNNTERQEDTKSLVMKRRLQVLEAIEQKVKAISGPRHRSDATEELALRVIQIRMSKLRSDAARRAQAV